MAAMTFKPTELFGGAMTADIPEGFGDVSLLRPVPSHQEIHLSATGFSSLILEINQRVDHLGSDQEALRYHLDDIVTPGDSSHVWETSDVIQLPNFPSPTPTLSLVATTTPPTSTQPPSTQPPRSSTALLLTLIRLLPQSTDLLLTVNVPLNQYPQPGASQMHGQQSVEPDFQAGRYGPLVEEGLAIRDRLLRSLLVRDWALFAGA